MSGVARIGALLGAAAASVPAVVGGGTPGWVIAGLTASALVLVVVVLFIPSETPARRLGQLIQAWRNNHAGAAAARDPDPPS
ncbi:hypothetical protein IPZ68_20100 [Streptomyces arenae]|nr:hypothetical protein [Streptomyces arenae]